MAEDQKEQQAEKKSKLMPILLIVVGLLVVGGGSAAGVYFFTGGGSSDAAPGGTADAGAAPAAEQSILSFDTFVVNLADPKKDRFMKATMRAVVTDTDLESRLATEPLLKARTRDRILSVLSARSFDEITSPTGKETLRRELARELNQVFPAGSVDEVLFAELIIQ